jgi:flavin-dependent dehydrogenase
MVFDPDLAPLYGWLFPESKTRVNIGICVDGQDEGGQKTTRNLRETFDRFLQKHYGAQLKTATQVGKLKGHPIVYTTWVGHLTSPGSLFLGEAARITHNATGEGISQAMQSGVYAAEALSRVLVKGERESKVWSWYVNQHRKKFTSSFIAGHALRAVIDSAFLDHVADAYNNPWVRKAVVKLLGSALAGSSVHEAVGEVTAAMKKSA